MLTFLMKKKFFSLKMKFKPLFFYSLNLQSWSITLCDAEHVSTASHTLAPDDASRLEVKTIKK